MSVKEQRVDGSSVIKNKALKPILTVRCTLVAGKPVFNIFFFLCRFYDATLVFFSTKKKYADELAKKFQSFRQILDANTLH